MHKLAHTENVINPSIWRSRRGFERMSDVTKAALDSPRLNTLFSGFAALGTFLVIIAALVGWLTVGQTTAHDMQQFREQQTQQNTAMRDQISTLTAVVANLSAKIDQGPRTDQLQEIQHRMSSFDGRMGEMDTRMRNDEDRLTRTETLVQGIDQASHAQLGHH